MAIAQLHWAICAASALPELFTSQVNLGTVNSSKAARLCLKEESEASRKSLQNFSVFSSGFLCPNLDDFHAVLDFIARFTCNSPAVPHSPDTRLEEALVTFIYPPLPYSMEHASWLSASCGAVLGWEVPGLLCPVECCHLVAAGLAAGTGPGLSGVSNTSSRCFRSCMQQRAEILQRRDSSRVTI